MFIYLDREIGWSELVKRTVKDTMADDGLGLAAQLAYYFFLSLFPALLFIVALASFFPLYNFNDELARFLGPVAPQAVVDLLQSQLTKLSNNDDLGLLSLGLLTALWSSSAALVAIISAMNRAYDIEESRPWWKTRLLAMALTIGLAVFILISFALVVAGPELADFLGRHLGFARAFTMTWMILQWPVVFLLVSAAFGLVYYFAPDAEQDWVWITPGALVATVLWILASLAFRFYVINFANYEETYGTLGAIILTLLWFYITGLVMVVGAEVNAEIERSAPWAREAKPTGQKRRLGAAAAREWFKNHPRPGSAAGPIYAPR
jgi:membrane protein